MGKETKIVQVRIVDASEADVEAMSKVMKEMKDRLPYEIEFLVTNDKIEIRDVKYLIKELYTIYKMDKEYEAKKEAKK